MDSRPKFRRKKGWRHQAEESPFPVPIQTATDKPACNSRWFYYRAELVDGSVLVQKDGDGHFLYKMGFFGKGILSRGKPEHAFFASSFQGHQRKNHYGSTGIRYCAWANYLKKDRLSFLSPITTRVQRKDNVNTARGGSRRSGFLMRPTARSSRVPASERRFQQSRFQKVRQHRYQRHLSWKKMRDEEERLDARPEDTGETSTGYPKGTSAGAVAAVEEGGLSSSGDDAAMSPQGNTDKRVDVDMDSTEEQCSSHPEGNRSGTVFLMTSEGNGKMTPAFQQSCSGDKGRLVEDVGRTNSPCMRAASEMDKLSSGKVELLGECSSHVTALLRKGETKLMKGEENIDVWRTDMSDWSMPQQGASREGEETSSRGHNSEKRTSKVWIDNQGRVMAMEEIPEDVKWDRVNLDDRVIPSCSGHQESRTVVTGSAKMGPITTDELSKRILSESGMKASRIWNENHRSEEKGEYKDKDCGRVNSSDRDVPSSSGCQKSNEELGVAEVGSAKMPSQFPVGNQTSKGKGDPVDKDWEKVNLDDWTMPLGSRHQGSEKVMVETDAKIETSEREQVLTGKLSESRKNRSEILVSNEDAESVSGENIVLPSLSNSGGGSVQAKREHKAAVGLPSNDQGQVKLSKENLCKNSLVGEVSCRSSVPVNKPVTTASYAESRKRSVGAVAGLPDDNGPVKQARVSPNRRFEGGLRENPSVVGSSTVCGADRVVVVGRKTDGTLEGHLGKNEQQEGVSNTGACKRELAVDHSRDGCAVVKGEEVLVQSHLSSGEQIGSDSQEKAGTSSHRSLTEEIIDGGEKDMKDLDDEGSLAGQLGVDKDEPDRPERGSDMESDDPGEVDLLSERYGGAEEDTPIKTKVSNNLKERTAPTGSKKTVTAEVTTAKMVRKPDPYPVQEFLQLSYEETFFLSYGLGCLSLSMFSGGTSKLLDITDMWREFSRLKPRFPATYACYHYYRSKGWVPRSGIKYGCDFVIYKQGPMFFHSSFAVLAELVASDSVPSTTMGSWASFTAFSRIVENSAKDVLICFVIYPEDFTQEQLSSPACIPHLKVKEVRIKRWIPTRERERKEHQPLVS